MRALLAAFAALFLAVPAAAEERILSYDSQVAIQPDASLDVTETIRVRVENDRINHGIYRDFPTRYKGRHGERIRVGFELVSTSRDGKPEKNDVNARGNGVRVKIGDGDVTLTPGEHTYTIRYRATRMLGRFKDYDELYWNVTGNGWIFPIDRASATITLPRPAPFTQAAVYTGSFGTNGGRARVTAQSPGRISFATTQPLGPEEGLTVAAAFPKGTVALPDSATRLGWWASDVAPPAFALLGLLSLIALLYAAWRMKGRDPPEGTVVPIFAPPDQLSPAAMRYVTRQKFDNRAFAAALVDSAIKGHVRIEEEPGLLGLTRKRFLVGLTPPTDDRLDAAETAAVARLVGEGERLEMDNENHSTFSAANKLLAERFDKKFVGTAFHRNTEWALAALMVWAVGAILTAAAVAYGEGMIPLAFAFVPVGLMLTAFLLWRAAPAGGTGGCLLKGLAGLFAVGGGFLGFPLLAMALISGNWIPVAIVAIGLPLALSSFAWIDAPTREGRAMLDRIAGFKQYLSITEKDRLDRMQAPEDTLTLFERFLPYAIALGVENRWADRFASQLAAAAAAGKAGTAFGWYAGGTPPWDNPGGFVSDIGDSLSSAISSASTAPGSSSGSGGGGFSGGGGGGGGGGGW